VAGEGTLTILYQVRAGATPGVYVNSATATASVGASPTAPAGASVELIPPFLVKDDFTVP
jgi:hypothetical protein